ncbi:MAG: carbohydrate ABC transporter permease [Aestuariivirga sp.]
MERRNLGFTIFIYISAAILAALIIAPMAWLFIMSISPTSDLTSKPLHWLPTEIDPSRYQLLITVLENTPGQAFLGAMRNSVLVAGLATVLAVTIAIPAAWAVSRTSKIEWSLYAVVSTYMLPPVALCVPFYGGLAYFDLLNSKIGLTCIYLSILAPFTTWILKSSFDSIPRDYENAAMIDGARLDQMFRIIFLPLAAPAIATTTLFAFLMAWDEFFYALLFTSDLRAKTLTVAIADLAGGRIADYGLIATAGVLAALPPVLIGLFLQRAIVSGLTSGGLKG